MTEKIETQCTFCGKTFQTFYDYETGDQDQTYCDEHEEKVRIWGFAEAKEQYLAKGGKWFGITSFMTSR